ncbi:MAG TPA: hypothetical protein VEU33_48010, partial [Archangium sp.]|nr:hypothetical protein [Archangium sp.]
MALVGAACALLLAVVAGVCATNARAAGNAETRWSATAREPSHQRSLWAPLPGGRHQGLMGVHGSPVQGQLELPRPTANPLPGSKRFDSRHGLAPRPEAGVSPV